MKFDKLIGNTPLIKIKVKYYGKIQNIYAKLEYYNLTGSIKDRMAYYIIQKGYENKLLRKGMPIVEATSGNTGISFAALGSLFKHPVYIFMPKWTSQERIKIMEIYGARVYLVNSFDEAIRKSEELAEKINGFLPHQFENELNPVAHFESTGEEICEMVPSLGGFVSGIGTGGTLMGIARKIKTYHKDAKIIAMEPEKMPLLSQGKALSQHKIEGIGDDFIPKIIDKSLIDEIITVNDDDAINMARILARETGLGVGISSGANLIAAILSGIENIVTIFPDDLKKYLSTELHDPINLDKSFISNNVLILSVEVV